MDAQALEKTILAAKVFLNANRPPKKESIDGVIAKAKAQRDQLRDFFEEDSALFWPEAPPGMYLNTAGIPMQKNFYSRRK